MAEAPSRFSPKTLSRFNSMLSLCESNEQVELAHQMIQQQVADLSKDAKDSRVRVGPQEASQVKKGGDTNSKDASFEAKQNQEQEQEHQKRAQALLKGARARKGGSHPPKNKIDSYRPSNLNRHREHRDEIRDRPVKGDSGEKHGSGPKHGDGKQQGAGSSKYTAKGEKHSHEGRSSGGKPYGVVKKGRTGSH
ncbi:hypothetical protein EV356DRAFT_506547 [Viridothelium virens]|uniref:Uncharacterized protein n=1 Tax=Viridothelium virens TaxID=1048519 RepID=A0A6A6H1J5_VIRVR|nr:hypothetical protein EV356DRAFT_506547 [Viridothelium virens]